MTTEVLAPVPPGRAVALSEVPDPVFAQGMVGHGAAIDPPPHTVVEALAPPVSGTLLKLMPHAYIVLTPPAKVGVLVHLGLDTVALNGGGLHHPRRPGR